MNQLLNPTVSMVCLLCSLLVVVANVWTGGAVPTTELPLPPSVHTDLWSFILLIFRYRLAACVFAVDCSCKTCYRRFEVPHPGIHKMFACGHKHVEKVCQMCYAILAPMCCIQTLENSRLATAVLTAPTLPSTDNMISVTRAKTGSLSCYIYT
jgi:hypothetical protein